MSRKQYGENINMRHKVRTTSRKVESYVWFKRGKNTSGCKKSRKFCRWVRFQQGRDVCEVKTGEILAEWFSVRKRTGASLYILP